MDICRAVAQLGSAPPWGGGGRRFKSCQSDHLINLLKQKGGFLLTGFEQNAKSCFARKLANVLSVRPFN